MRVIGKRGRASCPGGDGQRAVISVAVPAADSMTGVALGQAPTAPVVAAVYNDKVVRAVRAVMTVVWGIVGMAVGAFIAAQLFWPELNFGVPWLSYGRLRPLHTNAVIFAFGGCALFATSYYVVQRTCHVRLISDKLAAFTFWGWQAVIVLAAITLPAGMTSGKEYAELEWPIDLLIAVVWVELRHRVPRYAGEAPASRTSTWPTGSSPLSSSPLRCCTS